ncbi:DUF1493 family protein, partial [Cronobacter sakazakii]
NRGGRSAPLTLRMLAESAKAGHWLYG